MEQSQRKKATSSIRKGTSRGTSTVGDFDTLHSSSRNRSRQKDGKPPISTVPVQLNPIDLMYLDKEALSENLKQTNLLMQQHREEGNVRQMRHEQRRRKFMRQLDTALISQTNKYFEQEVIGQLLNVSRSEQQELDFRSDVYNYQQIILLNRKNRDRLIEEINSASDSHARSFESVEAKREVGWVVKLDTRSQLKRRDALLTASSSANRCEATIIVKDFMDKLLDVVDWTINCREIAGFSYRYSNPEQVKAKHPHIELVNLFLPELLWNDIRRLASSAHPFASPLPHLIQILPSTLMMPFNISQRPHLADAQWILTTKFNGAYVFDKPRITNGENQENIEETLQLSAYLAKQDWIDFIQELNQHNANIVIPESTSEGITYPEFFRDAFLTPSWLYHTLAQFLAGETIVQIRTVVNPIPVQPEPNVRFADMSLRMALFGASEVSRKLVSKKLQAFFPRLHVISVDALVLKAFYTSLPTDKPYEQYSPYEQLVHQIQQSLQVGDSIQNDQYAQLIIQEVKSLPTPSNGFVLEDYPNTKEQLLSLLQATSNIRYDEHRPQPKDYLSPYAPLQPSEDWMFDISNSGFDVMLCVDSFLEGSGIEVPLREKIRARKNLYTQEVVYLDDNTQSVKGLQYIYDPSRPYATTGLALTMQEREVRDILEVCAKIKLLQFVRYDAYPTADEAIDQCLQMLADVYLTDPAKLTEEYWVNVDEQKRLVAEAEAAAAVVAAEAAEAARLAEEAHLAEEAAKALAEEEQKKAEEEEGKVKQEEIPPVVVESATSKDVPLKTESTEEVTPSPDAPPATATVETVVEKRLPIIEQARIPEKLASILSSFWNESESHAALNGEQFYGAVRDLRYATIQRRRIAMDAIYISMLRQDTRQELFNKFREDFNAIDNELRFDPDCIADLYLRSMQLRNEISKLCESRYQEVQKLITSYEKDNQVSIFTYSLRSTGMFLLQNELNRFYELLDILFDATKSVQTYQVHEKIANELEALLPPTVYELQKEVVVGKGKDAGKEKKLEKSKTQGVATFTPYREVLSPYVISTNLPSLTEAIPAIGGAEEVVDPKAKGKGKDKKGSTDESANDPFSGVFTLVMEEIAKWKQGTYTVSRDLYGGNNKDEKLCESIEKCIWFEAGKVELSCQMIRQTLDTHIQWMEEMEKQTFIILQEIAYDRFLMELAAGEEVIAIIEQCIQQARPLSSLWLVTPDAMPVIDPETVWQRSEGLLPDSELRRFDLFGGITRPEPLALPTTDSMDEIPVTFSVDDANRRTPSNSILWPGTRPFSSPADLARNGRSPGVSPEGKSKVTLKTLSKFFSRKTGSGDSYDEHNSPDQISPSKRKLERAPSYNYLKKLMPPHNYHKVQRDNYLASQGRLPGGNRSHRSIANYVKGSDSPLRNNGMLSPTGLVDGSGDPAGYNNGGGGFGGGIGIAGGGGLGGGGGSGGIAVPGYGNIDSYSSSIAEGDEVGRSDDQSIPSRSGTAPSSAQGSRSNKGRGGGSGGGDNKTGGKSSRGNSAQRSARRDGTGHSINKNALKDDSRSRGGSAKGRKSPHGGRRHSHAGSHNDRPSSSGIEPKEYEKYEAERNALEEKLMLRREMREKEFIAMGLSVPNAKLAAYNELLQDEHNAWSDFDNQHKRMLHSSSSGAGTPSHRKNSV